MHPYWKKAWLACLALGLLLKWHAPAQADGPVTNNAKRVFEIPIEGTIDLGLAPFVERVIEEATPNDTVVLRIKTFGGRVDAAVRIRDALLDAPMKTVAYVDRRAISAGALISLACDTIIMSEGASIGASTPVQGGSPTGETPPTSEKIISYMRAEMRATAEAKGRRGDIAEAMVDPDIAIKGVTIKGKLLTLTSDKALKLKIADAIVPSYDAALDHLKLSTTPKVASQTHWAEKIARVLTDPTISSLLMTLGFLGLLMELYTPGFGVAGGVGLTCLILFFLGQHAAALAGWEEALLFMVGLTLLAVEVFVIPGFGVAGVLGLTAILAALVLAMIEMDLPWDVAFEFGYAQEALGDALMRLLFALGAVIVGAIVAGKYLPRSRLGSWMVLKAATSQDAGYSSESSTLHDFEGKLGRTLTALRPAGIALLEGQRVDVVSQGGFIDANEEIEVLHVDGNRVVVRRKTADA